MPFASLFSGGKDSTLALHTARQQGLPVCCLVTMVPKNPDSYMFHSPNIDLTSLHAQASGLPLVKVDTAGEKEEELSDLRAALQQAQRVHGATGVIAGAIASRYQTERISRIAGELGMELFAPLWHRDEEELLREFVSLGFVGIFVAVSAEGFGEEWLGRPIDDAAIEKLKALRKRHKINISGEGGEYETLVLGGPGFCGKIDIEKSRKEWAGSSGRLVIEGARLSNTGAHPEKWA